MITLSELEKAEISELPISKRVEAFFKVTDALVKFAEKMVIPVLQGQLKLNEKEKALVASYHMMYAWTRSMVTLNSRIYFQAVAAAARALFELYVDIVIISIDESGDDIKKFYAFPEIEKLKNAKRVVSFCKENEGKTSMNDKPHRDFLKIPGKEAEISHLRTDLYGESIKPPHWSGKRILERIKDLGLEINEIYISAYPILSWYIHSGITGYVGLNEEQIETCYGFSHLIAQKMFMEATIIIGEKMRLSEVIEPFNEILAKIILIPGKYIVEEQIKHLESLQRNES